MQADRAIADARKRVRNAWRLFGTYFLINACFYVLFEWHNAVYGSDSEFPFLYGVFFLSFLGASLIYLARALIKRAWGASLVYAMIFLIFLYSPKYGKDIDLTAKAYFFSAFPQYCPKGTPHPGYRVFICYEYSFSQSREALVFNPGDELAASSKKWPLAVWRELLGQDPDPVDECLFSKSKLVVDHIYNVSDDCWSE